MTLLSPRKIKKIALIATSVTLSCCATMDKLDRIAIERMGTANPIIEEATIFMPYKTVIEKLSALPIDDDRMTSSPKKNGYVIIKPIGNWYPDISSWEPGFTANPQFTNMAINKKEYKSYSREFKYNEGYPATKCKTACKISVYLSLLDDGNTYAKIKYTGDGDLTFFAREMRQKIHNLLSGRPIDAKPEKKGLSNWINIDD